MAGFESVILRADSVLPSLSVVNKYVAWGRSIGIVVDRSPQRKQRRASVKEPLIAAAHSCSTLADCFYLHTMLSGSKASEYLDGKGGGIELRVAVGYLNLKQHFPVRLPIDVQK